jgi:hypothetical protein
MCQEPTKYNSLEEVLSALAEGKKIRYQGWEKNCYVQIDNTHKKIRLNSGVIYAGNFNFESYLWVEYVSPALAFSELKVGSKYKRVYRERDEELSYFKVVYVAEDYIVCENLVTNRPFFLHRDQYDNFDTIKAE